MGHFQLAAVTDLKTISKETEIPESDYSILDDGKFYQFKYKNAETKRTPVIVKPGIWSIGKGMSGLQLNATSFSTDDLLKDFINTKQIEEIVDCFFSNLDLYKEFGIDVPRRGVLLYGPPGAGKSTAISMCANKYTADGKTAVVIWATDAYEAYDIKEFFKVFQYSGVEKLILIAEDLGGMENEETRIRSDSSLLALLDNNEKTFTIPTMILATTNHPENFAGNITNRSGRFDDKIEVGIPDGEARKKLLQFFSKNTASPEALAVIAGKSCEKFPPSSIREAYIRSRLRSTDLVTTIKNMVKEIELYEKAFSKKGNVGF
jgi:SpoVK/Ycf46/Vps4 family AAA+-type ATPase